MTPPEHGTLQGKTANSDWVNLVPANFNGEEDIIYDVPANSGRSHRDAYTEFRYVTDSGFFEHDTDRIAYKFITNKVGNGGWDLFGGGVMPDFVSGEYPGANRVKCC